MLKHCVEIMFGNKDEGCCRHVFLVANFVFHMILMNFNPE